ncbi:winged helix DNA-binding protein [Enterococcus pseudoavium]|uniref:Winged helix DNA-binding protein n=1 Tax=Enterococcus pseudoavium TaxID=44007 RepID=A0AAE4I0J0_9ENTE|nr:MarR family transcriptional regulator [Enterococcus pseudoavium]MDT2735987.1 winged helix DNA-binding protein [Enterococcus pseudoavium]MDT2754231.1 winged helix DNA-binding protein [Enterococcus pseudoavium]MDT2769987.1 winged helix DNA-binding protein [Enterococcus pseudoavium]REC25160.1 MarR family transcriptional regulator [Enterococcus pseudoavium]REC32899.1 MarR family transcriptional regulator [Enterococcus pseudoavium]
MTFAEEAERELMQLMVENRHGAFSKMEKSNKGANIVIKVLDRLGEPTNPKHLAETLNLSTARIAAVLGNLEKRGLIIRTMDADDRRRINVRLTESGKKVAAAEKLDMRNKIIRVFEMMGEEDTKKYLELTARFVGYSKQLSEEEEGEQE